MERRAKANPGEAEQGRRDWAVLIADVEKAVADGVDPASSEGKELAVRWGEMIRRFTLGDPETEASLNKLHADSANWPSSFKKPYSEEVEGFIGSDFQKQMIAQTPLGRFGQPGDIAPVAVFLASPASDWLTGETILASGGLR